MNSAHVVNGSLIPPSSDDGLGSLPVLFQKLAIDIEAMRAAIESFQGDQEAVYTFYNDFNRNRALMRPQDIQERETHIQQQYYLLNERKNGLIFDLRAIIMEYVATQDQVIVALKRWQRNQALAGNGAPFHNNLDEIQHFVETLMTRIGEILALINSLLLGEDQMLSDMLNHVRGLQNVLIFSAFVVEQQPLQVIKKYSRFTATVRWLIGPQLGLHHSKPSIRCEVLSEAQAKRHAAQNSNPDIQNCLPTTFNGEVAGNECPMEYHNGNQHFSANFKSLQIKQIRRSEKKGPEIVMDEKCTLIFYTTAVFNEYKITCWTLTLPFVVVVHGSQEPQSWATITWDNAFSEITREPFQVPDRVHWTQLLEALNMKFTFITGRSLSKDNLDFLHEKLCPNEAGERNEYITYSQFCRDRLPGRGFTFWDWFYAIMKLTKDHLLNMWREGLIVGFINKRRTMEEILPMQENGTFLLRFSDSESGGITIALRDDHGNIMMLAPWTANDLHTRSLADRIHDLNVLNTVYPRNLKRDVAFGSFYSQPVARKDYVPNTLIVQIAPPSQPELQNEIQNNQTNLTWSNSSISGLEDIDWQSIGFAERCGLEEESSSSLNSNGIPVSASDCETALTSQIEALLRA